MRCLEKLIEMGYEIGLKDGDFFYKATNRKFENSTLLKPIFEEIKLNKNKIIRFFK